MKTFSIEPFQPKIKFLSTDLLFYSDCELLIRFFKYYMPPVLVGVSSLS